MTFLNVWAAGFIGIAPVIVLLYLLKLKRRSLPVSTLLFWQRILQDLGFRCFGSCPACLLFVLPLQLFI